MRIFFSSWTLTLKFPNNSGKIPKKNILFSPEERPPASWDKNSSCFKSGESWKSCDLIEKWRPRTITSNTTTTTKVHLISINLKPIDKCETGAFYALTNISWATLLRISIFFRPKALITAHGTNDNAWMGKNACQICGCHEITCQYGT